jgi:hypothetical protein
VVHGLGLLAAAGSAPRTALNRPLATPERHLVTTTLPVSGAKRAAEVCGVHVSALVCTLVAEALRDTYPAEQVPERLRALFAVSRRPQQQWRTSGNWTGAIALDLPVGPMPVRARALLIRDHLRRALASGQPVAAAAVMSAMGALPAPVQAWFARRVYTGRFTNVIVSYLPGPREPQALAGAPVRAAVPVVPLADGVPLGAAAMTWGDVIGVSVLLDASLAHIGEQLVTAMHAALDQIQVGASVPASVPARTAVP